VSATSPQSVRVFVNAVGVDVPAGASVLDAVRCWSEEEAGAVVRGERLVTDSRGLPVTTDLRVSAGSIFRLVPLRRRVGGTADDGADDL
jgi:hypothetical protein